MKRLILSIMVSAGFVLTSSAKQSQATETAAPAAPSSLTVVRTAPESKVLVLSNRTTNNGTYLVGNTTVHINHQQAPPQSGADDPMRSKSFSKSFTLSKSDKVSIGNQFGSITVKVWNKNEIRFDADIKAYANTDAEAQRLLDATQVNASKEGDQVSFKSDLDRGNGTWGSGSRNGKRWRKEVRVNLVVYMPSSNALTATQQYGNIQMEDFAGPVSLKVQYGNLIAQELSNTNNHITVQYGETRIKDFGGGTLKHQYGNGITIGNSGTIDLNAQYVSTHIQQIRGNATIRQQYGSGLTIGSVGSLELTAQYSAVKIGQIKGNAVIKHQYGNGLTIDNVGPLELSSQYVNVKIGTLSGNAKNTIHYGGLTINEVENSAKNISVSSMYAGITLGFSADYHGDLEVSTAHCDFRYGSNVTARNTTEQDGRRYSTQKNYTGKIGRGGTNNIQVKSTYGSLTFK